jgi:hypothetical protein
VLDIFGIIKSLHLGVSKMWKNVLAANNILEFGRRSSCDLTETEVTKPLERLKFQCH